MTLPLKMIKRDTIFATRRIKKAEEEMSIEDNTKINKAIRVAIENKKVWIKEEEWDEIYLRRDETIIRTSSKGERTIRIEEKEYAIIEEIELEKEINTEDRHETRVKRTTERLRSAEYATNTIAVAIQIEKGANIKEQTEAINKKANETATLVGGTVNRFKGGRKMGATVIIIELKEPIHSTYTSTERRGNCLPIVTLMGEDWITTHPPEGGTLAYTGGIDLTITGTKKQDLKLMAMSTAAKITEIMLKESFKTVITMIGNRSEENKRNKNGTTMVVEIYHGDGITTGGAMIKINTALQIVGGTGTIVCPTGIFNINEQSKIEVATPSSAKMVPNIITLKNMKEDATLEEIITLTRNVTAPEDIMAIDTHKHEGKMDAIIVTSRKSKPTEVKLNMTAAASEDIFGIETNIEIKELEIASKRTQGKITKLTAATKGTNQEEATAAKKALEQIKETVEKSKKDDEIIWTLMRSFDMNAKQVAWTTTEKGNRLGGGSLIMDSEENTEQETIKRHSGSLSRIQEIINKQSSAQNKDNSKKRVATNRFEALENNDTNEEMEKEMKNLADTCDRLEEEKKILHKTIEEMKVNERSTLEGIKRANGAELERIKAYVDQEMGTQRSSLEEWKRRSTFYEQKVERAMAAMSETRRTEFAKSETEIANNPQQEATSL